MELVALLAACVLIIAFGWKLRSNAYVNDARTAAQCTWANMVVVPLGTDCLVFDQIPFGLQGVFLKELRAEAATSGFGVRIFKERGRWYAVRQIVDATRAQRYQRIVNGLFRARVEREGPARWSA